MGWKDNVLTALVAMMLLGTLGIMVAKVLGDPVVEREFRAVCEKQGGAPARSGQGWKCIPPMQGAQLK
jgi:hypothetical protein